MDKLIDCRAVIAGGAIRDLLLGADSRVKDLDIFVLGPGESTIQNLTKHSVSRPVGGMLMIHPRLTRTVPSGGGQSLG